MSVWMWGSRCEANEEVYGEKGEGCLKIEEDRYLKMKKVCSMWQAD